MAKQNQVKNMREVLRSNLVLFILIRETLLAQGADKTNFFTTVSQQAQLCGVLLPNHMRLTQKELESIRKTALAGVAESMAMEKPKVEPSPLPKDSRILTPGNFTPASRGAVVDRLNEVAAKV